MTLISSCRRSREREVMSEGRKDYMNYRSLTDIRKRKFKPYLKGKQYKILSIEHILMRSNRDIKSYLKGKFRKVR